MTAVCLDAWAVLAWLEGLEPAAERVERELRSGTAIMSWINLGEVLYVLARRRARAEALEVVATLRRLVHPELPTEARVIEAAELRGRHAISYADAFALATAMAHGAVLLTGDPEILAGPEEWPTEDLRP